MFGAPLQEGFRGLNPQPLQNMKRDVKDGRVMDATELQVAAKENQGHVGNMRSSKFESCMYTAQGQLQCGDAAAGAAGAVAGAQRR